MTGSLSAILEPSFANDTYDAIGRDVKDETGLTFSGANILSWQTGKTLTYTPTSKVATPPRMLSNSITTTAYDALDRIDTVTDPVGRKKLHFAYDASGKTLIAYDAWQSYLQTERAAYSYGKR